MIEFICPNCNQPITVPDKAAGRAGICPECRARVVVPGERAGEAPAPAPSAMDARKDLEPMASDDAPEAPAPAPEAGADDEVVRQPCPFCGELIAATAQKCRFCGESLEPLAANDGAAMVDTGRNPAVKGNTARHAAVSGNTGRNPAAKGNTGRHGAIKGDTERNPAVRGRTARHAVVNGATARNRAVAGGGAGKPSRSAPTGWMIGVVAALLIIVGIAFAMHSSRQAEAERQRMEAEERRLAEEKRQQQEKERQERLRRLEEANKETQRRLEQERAEKERQRLEAERKELQEQLRVEQDARAEEQRKRQAKADAEKQAEEEEKRHVAALKQAYHGADGGMVETLLNETRYRDNPEVRALRQRWLKVREHMEAGDAEEKKGNLEAAIAAWDNVRHDEPNANNGYHRQAKEKIDKYPPAVLGETYLAHAKAAFDAKQYARARKLIDKANIYGQNVAPALKKLRDVGVKLFNQGMSQFNQNLFSEAHESLNDALECFMPSDDFYPRIASWMTRNNVARREADKGAQAADAQAAVTARQTMQRWTTELRGQAESGDINAIVSLARQGDAEAQRVLGFRYLTGDGIGKNPREGVAWLTKAAQQGEAKAQCLLGACYSDGRGVTEDQQEAAKWFKKAAEQGDADAQFLLGLRYLDGKGVTENQQEAAKWFEKAAQQGNADAQCGLGLCYYTGKGVNENPQKAAKWFKKAAEQGDAYAQYLLGRCYLDGEGVAKDLREAGKWFKKAAAQGHEKAQKALEALKDDDLW